MTQSNFQPIPAWVKALYFVLSLLGSVALAEKLSEAMARARDISNFEGASGLTVAMAIPTFSIALVAVFWASYFVLRRFPMALYTLLAVLALASIGTVSLIASLL